MYESEESVTEVQQLQQELCDQAGELHDNIEDYYRCLLQMKDVIQACLNCAAEEGVDLEEL